MPRVVIEKALRSPRQILRCQLNMANQCSLFPRPVKNFFLNLFIIAISHDLDHYTILSSTTSTMIEKRKRKDEKREDKRGSW